MNDRFKFYYDESEHSRKITKNTISAQNYYDNFVSVIVGSRVSEEASICKRYTAFETKYAARKSKDELKSGTIKPQLTSGFASLKKGNQQLIGDYLDLFDDKVYVYFSVTSKLEYIINQIFSNYHNDFFADMDSMRYAIVKSLITYRPQSVISGIYDNTGELVRLLKDFYAQKIEENNGNLTLKNLENQAFRQIISLLDSIEDDFKIDWNYDIAFCGFGKYLVEKGISDYTLIIDKEGEAGKASNTLLAAKRELTSASTITEVESKQCVGVRMADMLAGTISKLLKALHSGLTSTELKKKLLPESWFNLDDEHLTLYKKLRYVISELNDTWYKSFSGLYADDLMALIAFLNYLNQFNSEEDVKKNGKQMHAEYFNSFLCEHLQEHFNKMHSKLPVEPLPPTTDDFFYNQRGAKCFFDIRRQPIIEVNEAKVCFEILSVGFSGKEIPLVTALVDATPICFRLPHELLEWATSCVGFANSGVNLFPAEVIFWRDCTGYHAHVL